MCDRWCGCEKYREYIELWVKYRKSNRKLKIYIVPSLIWVYVSVYICMYMSMYVCICLYMYECICECMYECICMCVGVFVCV